MAATLNDEQLLANLVAFNTSSELSNNALADFICEYIDAPNINCTRIKSPDGHKTNLVIRTGGHPTENPDRTGLVLSGHLDVVPANEPDWRTDPFTLTDTGDALAGRGACDMKGFVALALNLLCDAASAKLASPLVLLLTYDEEVGSYGALQLSNDCPSPELLPRCAIIGEPTSLRLVRMHKGHLKMRITCHGRGAHSGYPHLGVNAIEPAAAIVSALTKLRTELETETCETSRFFADTPFVALNVAQIHGGEAINIVPAYCAIDIGLRPLPGMESESLEARVRQAVAAAMECDNSGATFEVERLHVNPPMLLAENSETYVRLCKLVGQNQTVSASYGSDAGILQSLGLDCALFGPGTIEVAHKPNESVPKKELAEAKATLQRMIQELCN